MKWPSWWNVVLGVWLIIAPFVLHYGGTAGATEDVIAGIVVILLGLWSASVAAPTTGPAWANLIVGIWVAIAPWVVRYAGRGGAATNDVIVGVLVIILAAIRIGVGSTTARALPRP